MTVNAGLTPSEWQQAFSLVDELYELNEPERRRRLESLGASFARLKPVLRDLLGKNRVTETSGFLDELPKLDVDDNAAAMEGSLGFVPGALVGPYRLIREIGAGGMGAVWLAERADGAMRRKVALKLPYAGPRQQELAERFSRERDILAALTHPHIARLYDAGASASGQPYLAMEYIEGTTLTVYCDRRRLDIQARLALFKQVLSAVQYAHANLVLHRDLKPSNILVAADGHVSLLDFGIAKFMHGHETAATELTQANGAALTPDYASPEQIAGAALSTSSDVYSLGIVLYELLAGARPYKLRRRSRGELEDAILNADAPPLFEGITVSKREEIAALRSATPSRLKQALGGDLDTLVCKAIKKRPGERYATVDAFLADITRYLTNEPILAVRESFIYHARKFFVRHRLIAVSASLIFATMLAGIGATTWQAREAARQRDEAQAEARISQAYRNYMRLIMTKKVGNQAFTMEDLLDDARNKIEKVYANKPVEGSGVLQQVAQHYIELSRMQEGAEVAARALAMAREGGDITQIAQNLCVLGDAELGGGKLDAARTRIDEAKQLNLGNARAALETKARCLRLESMIALRDANSALAIKLAEEAVAIIERGTDELVQISTLSNLGFIYAGSGRPQDALATENKLLDLLMRKGLDGTSAGLGARNNRNMALLASGEFVEAEAGLADLMAQYIDPKPPKGRNSDHVKADPVPPYLLTNYGEVLRRLNRFDEADIWLQRAAGVAVVHRAQQIESITRMRQAIVAAKRGDLPQAEQYLGMARDHVLKAEPNNIMSPMRAWLVVAEANIEQARGNIAGARTLVQDALKALDYPAQTNRPGARHLMLIGAELAFADGDMDAALALAEAFGANTRKVARGPHTSADVGEAELIRARVAIARGNRDEAKTILRDAMKSIENGLGATHPKALQAAALMAALG